MYRKATHTLVRFSISTQRQNWTEMLVEDEEVRINIATNEAIAEFAK
jgi:hypothetical protein